MENIPENRRLSVTVDGELVDCKGKNEVLDFLKRSSSGTGLGSIMESVRSGSGDRGRSIGGRKREERD